MHNGFRFQRGQRSRWLPPRRAAQRHRRIQLQATLRIGISKAKDLPLRFVVTE
jgi:3-methyladenine DNA glycosylase Mpg